jgi:hypothetical protein
MVKTIALCTRAIPIAELHYVPEIKFFSGPKALIPGANDRIEVVGRTRSEFFHRVDQKVPWRAKVAELSTYTKKRYDGIYLWANFADDDYQYWLLIYNNALPPS